MNSGFTILVNSTDSFEECWLPFFKLFTKFWPNCIHKIVLNTETKDFNFSGLNILCSKVYGDRLDHRLTWSECLIKCLDRIEDEIILYLQEDYFINGPIDVKQIEDFVTLMYKEDISHISLVLFSNHGPWRPTKHSLLWETHQEAEYRISLQAGLWRKERLKYYLRKHENAWQFEVWGTKRSHQIKDSILCVNRDIFNEQNRQIIPYEPTGVIKGKWNKKAVYDLFLNNEIEVNFYQRGFYDSNQKVAKKTTLITRIISRLRSKF
jgi:hypothetical protein